MQMLKQAKQNSFYKSDEDSHDLKTYHSVYKYIPVRKKCWIDINIYIMLIVYANWLLTIGQRWKFL